MKKLFVMLSLLMATTASFAVPAKRGVWKTIQLADGTEVRVTLCGDEHMHYWQDANGVWYQETDNDAVYQVADKQQMLLKAKTRRAKVAVHRQQRMRKARNKVSGSSFLGTKKGLIILVNFKNKSFASGHDQALYNDIANAENYTKGGFKGSVKDYFKAQSDGQFILDFDVAGPVTVSQNYSYYGKNDRSGNDTNPEAMIVEACKLVDSEINFADYDWDGDGKVDQVYVVYAGHGEADYSDSNTIWPHEYELSATGKQLTLDGVTIDTYACGPELDGNSDMAGIGTFCHEFSHCLGYPDMYDTEYDGYFGMGDFDLMCGGSYNGDSFVPAGYTGYEKMVAGWITPIELTEDIQVDNLKPMSESGDAYIMYNDAHKDEYYIIENRQLTGFDKELPGKGLMITHVDYDATAWEWNIVNTVVDYSMYGYGYAGVKNDHERLTIFHADNDDDKSYWNSSYGYYTKMTESTDLYPYGRNDSLTNTSKPAATLHNANTDGKKLMNKGITGIKQNSDGTMAFNFRATAQGSQEENPGDNDPEDKPSKGDLLSETFDDCDGTGGNDGKWGGYIANANLNTDMSGWDVTKGYGANQCAKFGSTSAAGSATSPAFTVDGEATLTFKAAPWNEETTSINVTVSDGASVSPSTFSLTNKEWTDCKVKITGNGAVKLTFTATKNRFFLDEVNVASVVNAIKEVKVTKPAADNRIYSLDGRFVGNDFSRLSHGIYIVNGKKMVK